MEKLIINFTPSGMIPIKEMTAHVPVSPDEIACDVLKAADLGASIAHIHARDENGLPTHRGEVYGEIISKIRKKNKDIIICVSTSGRNVSEFEKRSEVLDLEGICKPDMASLTMSSLNFNNQVSINPPETIKSLAEKMLKKGIKPELEVFDAGMINYSKYLIRKGLLHPPYYFNIILGNIACAQADLLHIGVILNDLPGNSIWSLGGVGDSQLMVNSLAIVWGGGIRVGLEDNIWFDSARTRLATNEELVRRAAEISNAIGRQIASPAEVRCLLGLDGAKK
jgi:uncharacterized protein (DUF849 family)